MKPTEFPEQTCWHLSWRERLTLLFTGRLWIRVLNFGQPLQPQKPSVKESVGGPGREGAGRMKYRKKPVVVRAVRWTGDNWSEIAAFHRGDHFLTERIGEVGGPSRLLIATLEGTMAAEPGDWIIEGVKGEVYPCKPDIFAATYEAVHDD